MRAEAQSLSQSYWGARILPVAVEASQPDQEPDWGPMSTDQRSAGKPRPGAICHSATATITFGKIGAFSGRHCVSRLGAQGE